MCLVVWIQRLNQRVFLYSVRWHVISLPIYKTCRKLKRILNCLQFRGLWILPHFEYLIDGYIFEKASKKDKFYEKKRHVQPFKAIAIPISHAWKIQIFPLFSVEMIYYDIIWAAVEASREECPLKRTSWSGMNGFWTRKNICTSRRWDQGWIAQQAAGLHWMNIYASAAKRWVQKSRRYFLTEQDNRNKHGRGIYTPMEHAELEAGNLHKHNNETGLLCGVVPTMYVCLDDCKQVSLTLSTSCWGTPHRAYAGAFIIIKVNHEQANDTVQKLFLSRSFNYDSLPQIFHFFGGITPSELSITVFRNDICLIGIWKLLKW